MKCISCPARWLLPLLIVLVAGIALVGPTPHAGAKGKGNPNPRIAPPGSKPHGRTYGEWAAKWWQAAFQIPVVDGNHPLFSGGAFGGEDGVLFLAGASGATINLTIPPGTPLFFPIVNTECSVIEPDPFHGDDEAEMRACANRHIDNTSGLFAEIDGEEVIFLEAYRSESPLFVFGPLPADNVFGVEAGTTSPSVDAGVYLFLPPLSVGEHEIHFGGTFDEFGFSIDTTYHITVAPKKKK